MVAFCSKPWKLEAIFEMWKEPCIDGLGCLGDPSASGMMEASMVASRTSVVVASMASLASMTGMDLMAPELKSERKRVQWFGAHLLHPTLRIKPFVLFLFRCPLGTLLLMSLHSAATPRENDGSRSLRRVVKIGGMRAEGVCKIGGERAEGLPCKSLTKLLGNLMLGKLRKNW